ncbi:LysR family transcriptional regulator [Thalassovita mediterranea]|uniref:D-malate degradation protein R n=1 Tax=Thalassovita mediterranea TaxID=340021 RepID=A0A0P1GM06_9RHOB|nr:LysR family transcriptional regulator [Thalassovita mediterranea]CUH83386.1 D-malate degradation protein R [Thalassovita mediterranea]SIS34113.1 transcriptional regulator, LysR family [Thalassovita mediterranea]
MIYNDLALFTAVATQLSFSAAAEQLNIPLSRVSRRISDLEDRLGVKLFERTTRRVRLTEEGRRLLDRCQDPIEALQQVAGFSDDGRRHIIRLTAPPLAARKTVGPKLLDFAEQHPDVEFDLTTTNLFLDFFRDNIDLAFRVGPLSDSNLIAKRLWSIDYCFCASAAFVADRDLDRMLSRAEFLSLPALVAGQAWTLDTGETLHPKEIAHSFGDLDVIKQAVRRNLGVAMLPRDMVDGDIQPLTVDNATPLARDMFAVYPSRRLLPVRIRKLIDHMASG